jgi:protein tyrosine/serine phosphatase
MSLWQRFKETERAWRSDMGADISTPKARARAWRHYLFIDHGVLRVWWRNFHQIAPGAFRSNQPSPARLKQFKDQGIRTVLNLRGVGEHSHYLFEKEACAELGLTLIDHRLYAADLASRQELLDLIDVFRSIEKPFVMHCKSGADRTGIAAAIYRIVILGASVPEAMGELNWRYIHFRHSKNGILDHFFDEYLDAAKGRDLPFLHWLETEYDADAARARYQDRTGRMVG